MRKKVFLFLFFCLILTTSSKIFASVKIDMESKYAYIGDEVEIALNLSENSGIVGGEISILYPSDKLEYIEGETGEVFDGNISTLGSNEGKVKLVFVGLKIDKIGNMCKLKFKLKDGISSADIPLDINVESIINDKDGKGNVEEVEYTANKGYIKIIKENEIVLPESGNLNVEKQSDASYKITQKDGKEVKYSSSDENIAIVDDDGNVIPKSEGTVKITATYSDGTHDVVTINIPQDSIKEENTIQNEEVNNVGSINFGKYKLIIISACICLIVIFIIIMLLLKKRRKNNG